MIEKEITYLKLIKRAIKTEKQKLQREVQTLIDIIKHFRSTTIMSLDKFTNKIKFNLSFFVSNFSMKDNM